jgi:hypothetical protein
MQESTSIEAHLKQDLISQIKHLGGIDIESGGEDGTRLNRNDYGGII